MLRTTTAFLQLLLLLLGVAAAPGGGVCDQCKCQQEGGTVTAIDCHCCPDMRDIDVTERLMRPAEDLAKVKKLSVSDCNSVSFRQSSLFALKALDSLEVVNVSKVNFDDGAFEKMASLLVEKVGSLDLAENAFFATELRRLHLQASKLQTLPPKALANIRGLVSLRLEGVTLHEVSSHAVVLDMASDSSEVVIKDCLISKAEPAALTVMSVGRLVLQDTTFRDLDAGAVNVTAQVSALVNGSDLTDSVPAQALCVAAPQVTVVGSKFSKIPECALLGSRKVVFERNEVEADLVSLVALTGDSATYRYNSLLCDCVVEFGKKLAAIGSNDSWVLDNNYCHTANCPEQLPMSVLVKYLEEAKANHCSEEELCRRIPTTTTMVPPHPLAGGRAPTSVASVAPVLFLSLAWMLL